MGDEMKNAAAAQSIFGLVEILGLIAAGFGGMAIIYSIGLMLLGSAGAGFTALFASLAVFGSGISLLMGAYIGQAILHISQTNSQILEKLSQK